MFHRSYLLFIMMLLQQILLAAETDRQYIVFMRVPETVMDQDEPSSVNKEAFLELHKAFGDMGRNRKKTIGMGFIFSYLKTEPEKTAESLKRFLQFAQQTHTPVLVKLDGEQWWQGRPDLWNWWDPSQEGYNPENRQNVEWTNWDPEDAVKISWRNWGRQMRVKPAPNLMSSRYRQACHEQMAVLIPIVLRWWKELPESQKDLFIGLNVGWESSIGANAFYYSNGNDLLNEPEELDPKSGLVTGDVLNRGVVQIGYAALKTAGIRHCGDITESDLAEVARRHLEDLCAYSAQLGVPREKLFSHGVGWENDTLLYSAALNRYSCPGWSIYRCADDPMKEAGFKKALVESDAPYWAAVEWMLLQPFERQLWKSALKNTLKIPRCKFICVYNWEGCGRQVEVQAAVREIVAEAPKIQ